MFCFGEHWVFIVHSKIHFIIVLVFCAECGLIQFVLRSSTSQLKSITFIEVQFFIVRVCFRVTILQRRHNRNIFLLILLRTEHYWTMNYFTPLHHKKFNTFILHIFLFSFKNNKVHRMVLNGFVPFQNNIFAVKIKYQRQVNLFSLNTYFFLFNNLLLRLENVTVFILHRSAKDIIYFNFRW